MRRLAFTSVTMVPDCPSFITFIHESGAGLVTNSQSMHTASQPHFRACSPAKTPSVQNIGQTYARPFNLPTALHNTWHALALHGQLCGPAASAAAGAVARVQGWGT